MDRFDVQEKASKVMELMLSRGVIDIKDIYALAATHKDDFNTLLEELSEINYSNLHTDNENTIEIIRLINNIITGA